MSVHAAGVVIDEEASLATRAAWLYFAGGLTQAEIANRLNVPSAKAHRLDLPREPRRADPGLRRRAGGRMRPSRGGDQGSATASPSATSRPISTRRALPLKTLGLAGATFLRTHLETGGHDVIGVGHGRTLAAAVAQLPQVVNARVKFVSLLGGLTRKFSASPFDVIHRLAERTGAEAYLMPVPVFANTASDRRVLLAQIGIADVFDLARSATLMFVGIGEVRGDGLARRLGHDPRRRARGAGARRRRGRDPRPFPRWRGPRGRDRALRALDLAAGGGPARTPRRRHRRRAKQDRGDPRRAEKRFSPRD